MKKVLKEPQEEIGTKCIFEKHRLFRNTISVYFCLLPNSPDNSGPNFSLGMVHILYKGGLRELAIWPYPHFYTAFKTT